jgi:integrase
MTEPRTETRPRKTSTRDGLFQRAGWWWVDYYDADGRRHRKKAAPDYTTAKIVYRDIMTGIAKGEVLGVREEGIRFRDFADKRYWPTVKPSLSTEEQVRARGILDRQLLPRFGDRKLSQLRREELERWQAERRGTVAAATANKELSRLGHLLNRAVDWGYLKATPVRGIRKAQEAPGRVRYLSPEEYDRLLNGADITVRSSDGRAWTTRRTPNAALRLYMLAALHTGARRGELVRLQWADVDLRARTLTFRRTKNGDARSVPLTATLRETLTALPRPLSPTAPVLPVREPQVVSRAFARLVDVLEIPHLRFHDLRHHAGSVLTMAGVPQRTIMEILGHRDPRMTVRYQHLSPGHLHDAMQALDPRPVKTDPGARAQAR